MQTYSGTAKDEIQIAHKHQASFVNNSRGYVLNVGDMLLVYKMVQRLMLHNRQTMDWTL